MSLNREEKQQKPAETSQTGEKAPKPGLFDLGKFERPLGAEEAAGGDVGEISIAGLDLNGLLELRGRIDERLPARSLADLDLEEEVLLQFARTKQLYDDVVASKDTPANQKAQVANSCSAILEQLVKMQGKIYSAERMKAIEGAIIRTLRSFPDDVQKRFFETYERALESLGLPPTAAAPAAAPTLADVQRPAISASAEELGL